MSAINIINVRVLNDPLTAPANSSFDFEITFECTMKLETDIEWRMVFVGDAQDESKDQILDSVEIGPLEIATMKFEFSAPPPNLYLVPKEDQLDVTAMFLAASYKGQEFCRIGYYLKHEYPSGLFPIDPVSGLEQVPEVLQLEKIIRKIDADNPRVTRFIINWDTENVELLPPPATYAPEDEENDIALSEDDEGDELEDEDMAEDVDMEEDEPVKENGFQNQEANKTI